MIARRLLPCAYVTSRTPKSERSRSAGTFIGPGDGAAPGAGWGQAVDVAVWKVMLPSTFCMIWWMWPFSTVTDPKRLRYDRACSPSSVTHPHLG